MNLLTMEHVSKAYTDRVLLDDVGFGINKNEKIGVIGVNGMGKSTLLKIVAGIEESDAGTISMGNQVKICYLPQTPVFEAGTTILRAATEGNYDELNRWTIEAEAKSMLNQLGFTDYAEKIEHMSGGQKKRVAIAGVLAMNPKILILDEPTAGLDPKGRDDILDQIAELHKVRGITIILVSHSMEDIAKYAERLIVVNDGEIAYDDAPKAVFAHYRELEAMGLAAPQITYIMHALKEKGLDVDVTATTVDEAKENILAVLRKCNPGKLSGDRQSVSDSQSKKENAKAETLISEMEADLTEDGTKESHSDAPDEDLSIQKETMDKKSAEQEENEGGQEV